jgi:hypothetical protein
LSTWRLAGERAVPSARAFVSDPDANDAVVELAVCGVRKVGDAAGDVLAFEK